MIWGSMRLFWLSATTSMARGDLCKGPRGHSTLWPASTIAFFSFLFYPAFLSIAFPAPCPLSLHTQTDNKDREQCMPGVAVCTFQREREGVTMEGSTVGRGLVCYWTKKVVGGEVLICVHRRISHGAAKPGPPHINVQIHLVPEWTDPDAHLNPRRGGEAFRRLR